MGRRHRSCSALRAGPPCSLLPPCCRQSTLRPRSGPARSSPCPRLWPRLCPRLCPCAAQGQHQIHAGTAEDSLSRDRHPHPGSTPEVTLHFLVLPGRETGSGGGAFRANFGRINGYCFNTYRLKVTRNQLVASAGESLQSAL